MSKVNKNGYFKTSLSIQDAVRWTYESMLYPQCMHCLNAIAKYRNMHACLSALCLHACTYRSENHCEYTFDHPEQL